MKKINGLIIFLLMSLTASAQNVGIGTSSPQARLHVTDSSVLFSAAGDIGLPGLPPVQGPGRRLMWYPGKAAFRVGYINGTQWDQNNIGTYSFASGFGTTASQGYTTALGFFSNASGVASTAIGNQTTAKAFGALSIGSLNDFTDNPDPLNTNPTDRIFQIGNGFGFFPSNAITVLRNGNTGIGTVTPAFPLSFNQNIGDKISIWSNSANSYGLGIQPSLLQIHTDISAADIAFGYGSSAAFTEAMRIKGNGNVGIGIIDPQYPLDINGRMRLSGTTGNDAGVWLNNEGADRAFIGLQNNNQVGFFGNEGTGWGLTMNTVSGALAVGGNEGGSGQVLASNGPGAAASWANPARPYGYSIIPSQFTSLNGALLSKDISGVDNSLLVLNQNATVVYTFTLPVYAVGPGAIDSKGYVVIEIVNGASARVSYASSDYYIKRSTSSTQTASGIALNLPAGFYTIKARLVRLVVADGDVDTHASFNQNQQGIQFIAQILPN
ncbi:MAG: hypothetical protein ABJA37_04810 [Ferruginibacter sp.]